MLSLLHGQPATVTEKGEKVLVMGQSLVNNSVWEKGW